MSPRGTIRRMDHAGVVVDDLAAAGPAGIIIELAEPIS
jgi:hypothetical protein